MRNERAGGRLRLSGAEPAGGAGLAPRGARSEPPPQTDYNTKGNLENEYQHNRNNRKHHAP